MSSAESRPPQRAQPSAAPASTQQLAASSAVQPQRPRSCGGSLVAGLGVVLGTIYLLNPTAGLVELIPDALPGIGNLDEAGAAALLIFGLRYFLARRR